MKIDFHTKIQTVDGQPLSRSNIDDAFATLGWVAMTALLADNDESLDAKVRSFALAKKVNEQGAFGDITPEEATTIKTAIGRAFKNVTVVARSVEILNG